MVAVAIVAAGAIAAGATAYSASRTSGALENQAGVAQDQVNLARQLMDESSPLRQQLMAQLRAYAETGQLPPSLTGFLGEAPNLYGLDSFMQGGELPAALRLADTSAFQRDVLEQQFGRARESAMGQAPTMGGHLAGALTDLEGQRALGVTQLASEEATRENALRERLFGVGLDISRAGAADQAALRRALFGQALGLATGQTGQALLGLGGAGTTYGNIASTSLRGTDTFGDLLGTIAGYGLAALRQRPTQPTQLDDLRGALLQHDFHLTNQPSHLYGPP